MFLALRRPLARSGYSCFKLVGVVVEALLALLAAPDPDAVTHRGANPQRRASRRDATVQSGYEEQTDVELTLPKGRAPLMIWQPVPQPDLVAGNAQCLPVPLDDQPTRAPQQSEIGTPCAAGICADDCRCANPPACQWARDITSQTPPISRRGRVPAATLLPAGRKWRPASPFGL